MKQRKFMVKGIWCVQAFLGCGLLVLMCSSAFAQATPEQTTAPAADEIVPSLVEAGQKSVDAFEEANATATPAAQLDMTQSELGGDGGNETQGTLEKPSYGSFLEHRQEPKSTNIMDTGDSLIASAFSMAAYLCLILGLIFFAFWLLRKFGPRGIARGGDMINPQLVGRLMLGQKKHVDVVRVQGRTLLLA